MDNSFINNKIIVVLGNFGTGKTKFFHTFKKPLGKKPLIIHNCDSIRDFKLGYHNVIVMNDMDFNNFNVETIIKLLDIEDDTTFNI